MSVNQDEHQTTIKVENTSHAIYIGEETIAAIRGDALSQLQERLETLDRLRDEGLDPTDEDQMMGVWKLLGQAEKVADTLVAVLPPDDTLDEE